MVKTSQLHELMEFFHAFVGFCVDPSSLLSPLSKYPISITVDFNVITTHNFLADHKRPSAFKSLNAEPSGGQSGSYASNFGSNINSTESQVIAAVFKAVVTRFVQSFKELKCQENIALYSDVRQLITFVKNTYGGTFRRVALSGVLDVTPKPHKKAHDLQTTRVVRHIQHIADNANPNTTDDPKFQRKLFFKKRSTSSTCASLLETDGHEDQICDNQSPVSNLNRKVTSNHPTLTPKHSERTFFPDSSSSSERNSVGRLGGIGKLFSLLYNITIYDIDILLVLLCQFDGFVEIPKSASPLIWNRVCLVRIWLLHSYVGAH